MRNFFIVTMSFICIICTGCFKINFDIMITSDGAVVQQGKFIGTAALTQQIEFWKNRVEKNNPNLKAKAAVEGDMRGYKFEMTYPNIETFAQQSDELFLAQEEQHKQFFRRNKWFFDECSFDFYWASTSARTAFEVTINQALLSEALFDVSMSLPYPVEATNADEISSDRRRLTWHLAQVTINGGEKHMQAQFKLWHKEKILITAVAELLLFMATIFFFIKARSETIEQRLKDLRFKRNVFLGLFISLTLVSAYLM